MSSKPSIARKAKSLAASIEKRVPKAEGAKAGLAAPPGSDFTQWLLSQIETYLREHGKEMAIELLTALVEMAPGGPIVTKLIKTVLKILSLGT